jgi:hypothetical protein
MESIVDKYLQLLEESTDKGLVLSRMFSEITGMPNTTQSIVSFRKLNKIYGSKRLLNAVLDVVLSENANLDKIYGLLSYLCKKQLSKETSNVILLDNNTAKMEKYLSHGNRKLEVKSPFNE